MPIVTPATFTNIPTYNGDLISFNALESNSNIIPSLEMTNVNYNNNNDGNDQCIQVKALSTKTRVTRVTIQRNSRMSPRIMNPR